MEYVHILVKKELGKNLKTVVVVTKETMIGSSLHKLLS
jgi:hypothetical protein